VRIGHLELKAKVSPVEVEEIDRATIQVLSDVGVSIAIERACQLFEKAGARVNHRTGVAKIPENLVG
jgi:trimethylamine:corrinoid methyltransferase-like protein